MDTETKEIIFKARHSIQEATKSNNATVKWLFRCWSINAAFH